MKIFADQWWCPLCGKQGALFGGARVSDVYLEDAGGAAAVCTKCAKNKQEEIKTHNELFGGNKDKKKNPKCKHSWGHPYLGRWYCPKCGATLNFTCGCGGSAYVCQPHYDSFVARAIKEEGSLEKYLAKHSW